MTALARHHRLDPAIASHAEVAVAANHVDPGGVVGAGGWPCQRMAVVAVVPG
jgi:hypothetical protein